MSFFLTPEEKKDILKTMKSESLKNDMRKFAENKKQKKISIDDFINFLCQTNEFCNHQMKKFKKIEGNNFLL